MATYYTLFICTAGTWTPEFGDYDREAVKYELQDQRDHGVMRKHLCIKATGERQADIDATADQLNAQRTAQ